MNITTEHSKIANRSIRLAISRGWELPFEEPIATITIDTKDINGMTQLQPYVRIGFEGDETDYYIGLPGLLYDRDFTQALWPHFVDKYVPTVKYATAQAGRSTMPASHYHMQQMVIADTALDALMYMGSVLGES